MQQRMKAALALAVPFTLLAGVSRAEGVKAGGYTDAEISYSTADGAAPAGLSNIEGALYLDSEIAGITSRVDIPFFIANSGSVMDLGGVKAQAYLAKSYESGLRWKLGQFDSTFGFEVNDTVDIFFNKQGLLYGMNPFVHAGLLVGYDVTKEIGVNLYYAAPNDAGVLVPGLEAQYGGQVVYTGSTFRFAAGALTNGTADGQHTYYDVLAGATLGDLAIDLEFNMDQTGDADAKTGMLAHAVYAINADWKAGIRGEMTSKTADDAYNVVKVAVGPQLKVTDAAVFKLDYVLTQTTATEGADAAQVHQAFANMVYRF